MYAAKNGNIWYTQKEIGIPTEPLDKCIFGVLFSIVVMLLLVGPMVIFSDLTGFVSINPVHESNVHFLFIIKKSLNAKQLDKLEDTRWDRMHKHYTEFIEEGDSLNVSQL